MSLLRDLFGHLGRTVTAYAGDRTLMLAAVSAAANVIVADGEVAGDEFETALEGLRADPVLVKGYDARMLETELYDGIARARTRLGRAENLRHVAALAGRPERQRENVFLIAADVADHDGISGIEASALGEIAAALAVDGSALLAASPVRRTAG
ncbi:tellurite resistance TerB family protein [Methylobacterium sp. NEAU 140]|uniref:tellurite resistance TerB family protein n=1 Tax=Methylobacterium sp. NEAU 140 TaxID=3064945 RepID=UPI002733CFBE|nr:tellurite resistance TerB family protein [Methylobacterium sp. NEAU 140]MDP4022111.1 tellurite resistance TerB family protein [Methylobacterium sp. NEAU 140]